MALLAAADALSKHATSLAGAPNQVAFGLFQVRTLHSRLYLYLYLGTL